MTPSSIRPEVRQSVEEVVRLRRDLHQFPELAFQEFRTSRVVADFLGELGLTVQTGLAKTGVMTTIEGSQPGPTLLLRADMDALPIEEQTGLPYASQNEGKMHACGHDGHTAILLATARHLAAMRERLKGKVRLIFQPAEEGPGGAKPMIEEGVLEGVDAAIGLHLWSNLPIGTATVCAGPMMAAADEFRLTIQGTGGHAALPHQGIDPILVGAHLVTAFQSIVSRNVDPLDSAAVSVTRFHGGHAYNVIPHKVELGGTARTFTEETQARVKQRLEDLSSQIAQAFEARAELEYRFGYPPLINDPKVTERVENVMRQVLDLPEFLPDARTLGGEDMAYYLKEVPGCFFFLGAANPDKKARFGHHHPQFDIDEDALPLGMEIFLRLVEDYLS